MNEISTFSTPEEEFDEHFMMLTNACMHLLDNIDSGVEGDIEALKQLRQAQRWMVDDLRVKEVETSLDGKKEEAVPTWGAVTFNNVINFNNISPGSYGMITNTGTYPVSGVYNFPTVTTTFPTVTTTNAITSTIPPYSWYTPTKSRLRLPRRY